MNPEREWPLQRLSGTPAAIHGRHPDLTSRLVVVCEPTAAALVLGSTQPAGAFDPARVAAAGLDVARRRSGGGAVLVRPGEVAWIEAVLPAADRLWEPDVGRSFLWLGRAWAAALSACGVTGVEVHSGPLRRSVLSSRLCFAGLGPGEVTVAGRKVVGLAQRRRREGAVFQCAALLAWDPRELAELLALPAGERAAAARFLGEAAAPLPSTPHALTTGFRHALAEMGPDG